MKVFRRIASIFLILMMLLQVNAPVSVFAAVNEPQPPVNNLTVVSTGTDKADATAARSFINLKWDPLASPPGLPGVSKYINFYLTEVTKPYRPPKGTITKERDVSGNTTELKMKGLSSGTFYYVNTRAYYTYSDGNTSFTSGESAPSNTVKVLTDIDMSVASYGTNQIKIEWDDVWNSGRRIDYKLYVSDNSSFANTMPIYIGQSQIGSSGPVTVNQATGKLEYIHRVSDPARVYYVKIVPDITEEGLVMNPSTETLPVCSYILVKTTKMSETDGGTIWRLDWSPVVTGLNNNGVDITYQIDKYVNDVPIPMLIESGTSTFITIPKGGESNYYIIRANVTKNGLPLYPSNIKIVSDKITVKDQEVPSQPPMPELVNDFKGSDGKLIISYDTQVQDGVQFLGELQPNSATILWRVPKKADGNVDFDVAYDLWLLNDPNLIDAPPQDSKITLSLGSQNYVMDGPNHIGYKYRIPNLTPNSTYYVKIVARKTFIVYEDGQLKTEDRISMPSLKVIVTPAEGRIDQPLVPGRPPLKVVEGSIKKDRATIQLKNEWYERFMNGKWVAIDPNSPPTDNSFTAVQIKDNLKLLDEGKSVPDMFRKNYRVVKYDSGDRGVTIDVGCVRYEDGMSMSELAQIPTNKVIGFPVTANDSTEDRTQNLDNQKHNVNIPVAGLDPNTTYIIWVRASRQSADLTSGPSDPIIITTVPDDSNQVEKPVVPTFNYYQVSDIYIDLGWDFKTNYKYYIKYGTVDNINSASNTITTSTREIMNSGLSFLRIEDLTQDTLYYFWIQAEATNGSLSSKSEWSDSLPLKTLPDIPPSTPNGFGVKNEKGAVTKDSITFEWLKQEGNLEYILEIAGGADYKDVKEYNVGNVSEYKVSGLRSNFRYFARLYAYNPSNNLKSIPTHSVTVRTERSNDDYDSDQNVEDIASGDYIVKDAAVIRGTWTIRITGINADRFIEHVKNDKVLDYRIDAGTAPAKAARVNFLISNKVFNALSILKENLIIRTSGSYLVIRPEMLINRIAKVSSEDFNYEISVTTPDTGVSTEAQNLTFKTDTVRIDVIAYDGSNFTPVNVFNKPLKVIFPYSGRDWYKEGITSAYMYDDTASSWKKIDTVKTFDTDNDAGRVSFDTLKAGSVVIADIGKDFYSDIRGSRYEDAIANVASVHELKSISGDSFEPDKNATLADIVKLALDVMDYDYGSDYMSIGVKAGLIAASDINDGSGSCTREKAVLIAVRLYELKTGEIAGTGGSSQNTNTGFRDVSSAALPKVRFAVENGIAESRGSNNFGSGYTVTKGEFMGMLEKVLVLAGEID
ncbi:MAG: fibronectin type III domain-containing protein [Clostridia bacterium]|nr:fibronectin type III domain-containing protein [Clostridia bacterium]